MKKIVSLSLLGVFLFGLMASQGFGQKATDILEKFIEASGGRKLLSSVKDTTMTGTLNIVAVGMSGSLSMHFKEPNMMRMDMEVGGMVMTTAYDGETAWWTNPQTGATEELPADQEDEIIRMAYGNDILLNPDKHGVTYTLKESENIEGKDYFVLVQTFSDGYAQTMYIDSKTYLPYKTVATVNQQGVEAESETFLSDYRKIDGMMVSFSVRVFYDGEEAMTMIFNEVKYNTGLEDSLFKMD
jgi:outer membrane lipoprotein-sorting protein